MKPSATNELADAMASAHQYEVLGQMPAAEQLYRQVVKRHPQYHPAWHALGLLAFNTGKLPFAVQCIEAAIANAGKVAIYQRNIGELYRRLGQLDKAGVAARKAVKLAPDDLDAHYNLGLIHTDAKAYTKAVAAYRKALKLDANHGLSWNNLGSALEQQGDKAGAEKAYARAVAINPKHAEAQNNLGAINSELGHLDAARAGFSAAIAARPDFVEAHYNLSSLKTYTRDDPHLAMLEEVLRTQVTLPPAARIRYCFAYGKALDDIGEHDRAFAAYAEGNRLQHALLPMDEARADALLARIIEVFDAQFFADRRAWPGCRDAQRTPVFIVGMPRSGTTLLEQILSSHPVVYGAGELPTLDQTVMKALGGATPSFADGIAALSAEALLRIGKDYLDQVWPLAPDRAFISDKMPANFFYLGLIQLALPGAKIIHAQRDPMDSCFSCFTRLFNDSMEFAYDQGTLGRYYVRYMKLMDHWRRVLPPGSFIDVPYEDMVADSEGQSRRVLEYVGLPWDAACLKFYENPRLVKTASITQVRKPIYKTSLARWKPFARHLRPLLEIVKDYRRQDDASELAAALAPTADELHVTGIALYRQNRFAEALEKYDQALALKADFPLALNSKGFLLQDIDRLDEALACFERAVALAPEMAMPRLNLGLAQLKLGNWAEGWENYEVRWQGSAESGRGTFGRPPCPLPQWDGQAGSERQRLLVITEQGFGDTLQFARYLALLPERFAKVGFACSAPMLRLLEWTFGERIVLMPRLPDDFGDWDLQCPLLSLPRAFQSRVDSIPATVPYLRVPPAPLAHWRERLERVAPGRLRIGIAWAGRKGHQYDLRRSLSFAQIEPLLADSRVTWVSLQKWAVDETPPAIPSAVDWIDWTPELTDFADSAALISSLDLVITIDSAMVHLAGALGLQVWMMDRFDNEWRWLRGRNDSPWYPGLRIFRQTRFGDWDGAVAAVGAALPSLRMPRPLQARRPRGTAVSTSEQRALPTAKAAGGLSVEQAMQQAAQFQSSGRPREAEDLLRQILQREPKHAQALHLLGVVTYQGGQAGEALRLIGEAIAADPKVALFHSNRGEMCRQQGNLGAAIRHGEAAVAIDSAMASAQANLGIAYYDAKNYAAAEACQQKALVLVPNYVQSLNNLGSIARARQDKNAAMDWYRKALLVQPDDLETLSNLGAVLVEEDRADEAAEPLEHALSLAPAFPMALCNMGLVRLRQERTAEGIALLRRSLSLKPAYSEAQIGLARGLQELEQSSEAEALLREVVERDSTKADAWCFLGTVCMERGAATEAEAAYDKALALDPRMNDALAGLGNLRLEQGRIEAAECLLQQAVNLDPESLSARFHLMQVKKIKADDANLAALEALMPDEANLKPEKRIMLHYALGKAYDDLKEWERAFPHFIEGARIKRERLAYDANADAARTQRIVALIDSDFVSRLRGAGDPSEVPVFVLGMPRSGTTLTEQIIASHPEVYGAGELNELMDIVQQPTVGLAFRPFPDNLENLTPEILTAWGQAYVGRLRERAPTARRITDKMPANYLALGLIPLLLPRAKIIHVQRNPADTCVSCFTRLFNRHQDATYDLAELGHHYGLYARLMDHWRRILPAGSFLEVQYEDIVADTEYQARRLIDFCGLEWNSACLAFHKNKRSVRTASVTQVRQPIYNSSVHRWKHYEKFLEPLLASLGEYAPR